MFTDLPGSHLASHSGSKAFFHTINDITYGIPTLWRPSRSPVGKRDRRTWLRIRKSWLRCFAVRQREALQRKKVHDWHLFFCTDLARSVPLGSQSGTSLLRRSLSSPCLCIIIPWIYLILINTAFISSLGLPSKCIQTSYSWLMKILKSENADKSGF